MRSGGTRGEGASSNLARAVRSIWFDHLGAVGRGLRVYVLKAREGNALMWNAPWTVIAGPVKLHYGLKAFEILSELLSDSLGRKAYTMSTSQKFRLSTGGATCQSAEGDFWIGVSRADLAPR